MVSCVQSDDDLGTIELLILSARVDENAPSLLSFLSLDATNVHLDHALHSDMCVRDQLIAVDFSN